MGLSKWEEDELKRRLIGVWHRLSDEQRQILNIAADGLLYLEYIKRGVFEYRLGGHEFSVILN